jgi:hypothetical protein
VGGVERREVARSPLNRALNSEIAETEGDVGVLRYPSYASRTANAVSAMIDVIASSKMRRCSLSVAKKSQIVSLGQMLGIYLPTSGRSHPLTD